MLQLQVTPEQLNAAGGKILKSTIKSEKALLELQAAERKKAADVKSAAICEAVKIKEAAKFQQLQQKVCVTFKLFIFVSCETKT